MIKENLFNVKLEEKKVSENIILYGTGTLAREVYEVLSNDNYKIQFFINRNFEYIYAVEDLAEVKRYDDISIKKEMKNEFTVIIATFSPYADIHRIISDLKENGYKNIITYSELIDLFEDKFEEPVFLNKRREFLQNKERISMAADLWSDEKSKEIYESQVEEIGKRKNIDSITLLPCAVDSKTTQMKFNMGMQGGSNLDQDGSEMVQCVSMDECIRDVNATMIKMDVEGAEYEALLGCKNIIFDKKPNLAISIYHKPDDLYEIPLLIKSWNLGYKFYLRMYCYSGVDAVMYAVKEK